MLNHPTNGIAHIEQAAFYRFLLGDYRITIIHDGTFAFPTGFYGTNVEPEALQLAFSERNLSPDLVTLPSNVLLVETGKETILIDTGLGKFQFPGTTYNSGKVSSTLSMLGVEPTSIDRVILTHGHPDHIGGIVDEDGNEVYPNARYSISEIDWEFWTAPPNTDDDFANFMLGVSNEVLLPIQNKVDRFSGETELAAGITVIPAPGHTPGHVAVEISSGDANLLNFVDSIGTVNTSFSNPDWKVAADVDPDVAVETRIRLLERAADSGTLAMAYHLPFPGLGFVSRYQDGFRWSNSEA